MINLSHAVWRKSSRSGTGDNCVELAGLPGRVGIRDSKNPDGGALLVDVAAMSRTVADLKSGRYDLTR